jgi:hypothetical protein
MRRIITLDDGTRWRVNARSRRDAIDEIAHARATGSVGSRTDERMIGGPVTIIADVHQINSDYSDRKPS